jgi:hypothetical protein
VQEWIEEGAFSRAGRIVGGVAIQVCEEGGCRRRHWQWWLLLWCCSSHDEVQSKFLIENYLFHIQTSLFQLYVNIKQAFTSRVLLFTAATAAVRIVEGTLRGMYSPKGLLTVRMTS